MPNNSSSIILYTAPDGAVKVEVAYVQETFWLSQKLIAELFGVDARTISEHLRNIFEAEELTEESVIRKFRTTASDGKTYQVQHYSLDAIIAVGYRVNSKQATQFRIWATNTLKDFVIKGFILDDERLKLNNRLGYTSFNSREVKRFSGNLTP